MERLTMWYDGNNAICNDENCDSDCCPFADPVCEHVQNIIDRLDAIEDILGDDYDLDRLQKLVEADRAGMVMVIPCKPGQLIWSKNSGGVSSHQIRRLERNKDGDFACSLLMFPFDDFGKTVFLTREAAENALKERNNNENN